MSTESRAQEKHPGESVVPPSGLSSHRLHRAFPVKLHFLDELKRRNLFRVAILYLIACWVILEPTHVVFHMLDVPEWANRLVILLMAIGLPLVLLFSWVYEVTPEGLKPTAEVDRAKSITLKTGQKLNQAIIAVLSLAVIVLLADRLWLSKHTTAGPERVATGELGVTPSVPAGPGSAGGSAPAVNEKSIAVLPFADMSEKKDQEYFSDGLSEELIDLLARLPQLQVIARTSSFSFKGKSEDIPTIGRKLNVANVLEGSVRRSGNRLRVTTQLIRADSGMHVWSDTYDRELKDVFKVQDEIAAAVVAALKVQLLPSQQLPEAHPTEDTEAYSQYLLGRQLDKLGTQDDLRRAINAYRKAIELDPKFALAYARLSVDQFVLADETGDISEGYKRAMTSAEKALALAPEEAEGYRARGLLRQVKWDWLGAKADTEKALQLAPGESESHRRYAALLRDLGLMREGTVEAKRAVDLDPLSNSGWDSLSFFLVFNHEFAAAHEALRHALEISPEDPSARAELGVLLLREGRFSEAASACGKVCGDVFRLERVAMAEHSLGHSRESQQALDELIARYATTDASDVAWVYAWRGEKDKAFEWLERAYRQRDTGLGQLKWSPFVDSLRADPRFGAMLRKLKLPE